jgi:hypothetical protein
MDVFVRGVGGAIGAVVQDVFLAAEALVRGMFGAVITVVPLPLAALLALTVVLVVGWRFAK